MRFKDRWLILKVTNAEKEVAFYLTEEFLTVKQIALRRKTSVQSVYKIIKRLKEKGVIDNQKKKVENTDIALDNHHPIRLHKYHLRVNIIFKDTRYKGIRERANIVDVDGNTIQLFRDSILVRVDKNFYGDKAEKCLFKATEYGNRLLRKLEDQLKIILVKPRYQNIKMFNLHFAEVNNEIATEYEQDGSKLRLYADEDGKLAIIIDKSFNFRELEFIHPDTATQDTENVLRHIRDWRSNPETPTNTEIERLVHELRKDMQEIALLIKENATATLNNTNLAGIQAEQLSALTANISAILGVNKPEEKKKDPEQRGIAEYIG